MHTRKMSDSEGAFAGWEPSDRPCPKCGSELTQHRTWESSDGAYEDSHYRCVCGHTWWVDGIDS